MTDGGDVLHSSAHVYYCHPLGNVFPPSVRQYHHVIPKRASIDQYRDKQSIDPSIDQWNLVDVSIIICQWPSVGCFKLSLLSCKLEYILGRIAFYKINLQVHQKAI